MKISPRNISLTFAAGTLGGLINSLAVWLFGLVGVTAALGVHIAPPLTPPWLYPRLVWGGLWGWLFLLPAAGLSNPVRGLLYSLGPTLVMLVWVLPYQAHKGYLGLALGYLTPVLVLFYNGIWGLVAGWWLQQTSRK